MMSKSWSTDWSSGERQIYMWLMAKTWFQARALLQTLLQTWDEDLFDAIEEKVTEFIEFMDEIIT